MAYVEIAELSRMENTEENFDESEVSMCLLRILYKRDNINGKTFKRVSAEIQKNLRVKQVQKKDDESDNL